MQLLHFGEPALAEVESDGVKPKLLKAVQLPPVVTK